jgi:hypothetical protein
MNLILHLLVDSAEKIKETSCDDFVSFIFHCEKYIV